MDNFILNESQQSCSEKKVSNGICNSEKNFIEHVGGNQEQLLLPVFGYWKIRGLAQPVRFLLAFTETMHHEKVYEISENLSRESWLKDKYNLGLELPNLPYWIEGDIKLTQSRAILRHIARQRAPDLLGTTSEEFRRIDMLENHVWDFWMGLVMLCYRYSDEHRKNFLETLPEQLDLISKFMKDHNWSVSNNLTYLDFLVYEALYQHKVFDSNCLNGFPTLNKFLANFESLPLISKYMLTESYIHAPLYTKLAKHYI